MMDDTLRLQYLQAMGIDVWIPRPAPKQLVDASQEPAPSLKPNIAFLPESNDNPAGLLDWNDLQQSIANCRRCALAENRTQTAARQSNKREAHWLLIIDEPVNDPAVALLLSEMLRALDLHSENIVLTSALKCPVPKQRAPHRQELFECRGYLEQQIELLQPKLIVLFGAIAAQSLLQTDAQLVELRGSIHKFAAISTIVTYHPRFLLHALLEKRNAWLDLQLALTAYQEVDR